MKIKSGMLRILACLLLSLCIALPLAACGIDEPEGEKKITLSPTTVTITEGGTASVQATLTGIDEDVEWSSDNEEVATVKVTNEEATTRLATVTGVAEGTATITATADGKSATCVVTVNAKKDDGDDKPHEHDYEYENQGESGHLKSCKTCDEVKDVLEDHEYDNAEDTTCNHCDYVRTIGGGDGDDDDDNKGGDDDTVPHITEWETVDDPIHGAVTDPDGDYIWHHIFFNDAVAQAYDFDSYEATVELDGVAGEVVECQAFAADAAVAHTYHMQIRIKGNRYQTAVFAIVFKKDGTKVATGTYTRVGDKEIVLECSLLSISKGEAETISITNVNGKTDLTGLKILWSIADTEGENVATIPDNSNGSSVVVTAVSEGKATLTCTVGEGEDAFSATCTIIVVEGEVEIVAVDITDKIVFNDKFKTAKDAIQLRCELQGAEYAELVQQIDPAQTTVTVTMDGNASTSNVIRKEWQAPGVYNLWIQIEVESDWSHDYVFTFSFKNAKGDEVAYGTYQDIAPKTLTLNPTKLTLTLVDGETVTGTITATKTSKVEGDVVWSIDDNSVASITDNHDGTLTVTALKKGTATITATVDGLVQTCTVTVLGEDEVPTVPTVVNARIVEVYGGDVHIGVVLDGSDPLASIYAEVASKMAYVKVNGVKHNDMKDMFAFGADGSYRINAFVGGAVEKGVDYVLEICDADGNVLLQTVAIQWN